MGKSAGSNSGRPATAEEKKLWSVQADNLELMTKLAEEQFNIGQEDRAYYENVFRDGTDTQAKEAIAKLQSQITGKTVNPASIKGVNVDQLLRDTILNSTPEFKVAADMYIKNSNLLTEKYGADVTGISDSFKTSLQGYTEKFGAEVEKSTSNYQDVLDNISSKYGAELTNATNAYGNTTENITKQFGSNIAKAQEEYSAKLSQLQGEYGTARQDVLSRETGAAMGGISQAYAEARKQMGSDLARRGIGDSGVAASVLANTYQQEAIAKGQASTQARQSAIAQSDAIRQQELATAQAQYGSQISSASQLLAAQQQAAQGTYAAQGALAESQLQQAQLAGQGYQAGITGSQATYGAGSQYAQSAYQSGLGAVQNIYGVANAQDYRNYQLSQAAQLQGIAGLTQLAQAGQGIYTGSANYLAGAGQTAGSAAQTAGQTMTSMINTRTQAQVAEMNANAEVTGALIGAVGGMGAVAMSDIRLKTNIQYVGSENGHSIYTWDWREGFDGGYNKGVIAQEVLTYAPEAISIDEFGYYRVDYSMLGLKHLVEGVA